MAKEWFRNKTWSEAIESEFLKQLEQTDNSMKINALKIQGDLWLGNNDAVTQQAGCRLLEKLLADYMNDPQDAATVLEILGEYYYKQTDFEIAEMYLQQVVVYYREFKRTGVVRKADLLLAECILLHRQTDRFEEAYELVHQYPNLGGSLTEDHEKHSYYEILAYLSYALGKKEEAADCARQAIAIAQTIELDFLLAKAPAIEKCYQQLTPLAEIAGNKQ